MRYFLLLAVLCVPFPLLAGEGIGFGNVGVSVETPFTEEHTLKVVLTPLMKLNNHHYSLRVIVRGVVDQRFEIRSGQALTENDIRFASINADAYLDILIVGGKDHRGMPWYKTLLYDEPSKRFYWIGEYELKARSD